MLRAFLRAPSGVFSMVILAMIAVVVVVGPPLFKDEAAQLNLLDLAAPPSEAHRLGTDLLGRDILLQLIVATRLSILFGLAAAGIGAFLGIPGGAAAALLPPRPRAIALRVIDTLLSFPAILTAIFVGAIVGPGIVGPAVGIGISLSFSFARLTSALSLAIGGRDYISAARVIGVSGRRLLLRYILPNIAETLAIGTTVAIASSVVAAASLSFLGLGVQPPDYDWGSMLTEGVRSIYLTPIAGIAPAVCIAIASLAFGFFGEALARASNPVLWTSRGEMARTVSPTFAPELSIKASDEAPREDGGSPATSAARPVLEVRDLTVTFTAPVVHGVSFSLQKGDRLGIVGESGSGKTMTAMAIAQLVPYPGRVGGSVVLDGRELRDISSQERDRLLGTDLAVVYQDPLSSLNPALKIGTQITEGAEIHRGLTHREATALATTRLREVNIPTPEIQLERNPHELSGGMRQRVIIAMGLMNEPALLIADEPTTSLDVTVQAQIMDVLARVKAEHQMAIILISHNIGLISQNCDRVLVMYAGRVIEDLSAAQLMARPLHPYTRALLAAVPDMTRPREDELEYIPGQAPDPATLPPGCPYNPRCPLVMDVCRVDRPLLRRIADGRSVACWAVEDSE